MEKFELLYSVLSSLHKAGVLADCVLVGSWCQDFYRQLWGNPFQIPAARTTDADLLLSRQLKFKNPVDIAAIMEQNGFKIQRSSTTDAMRFIHEDFKFEFLVDAGAKADEKIFLFKNLRISAQELHFMSIPLEYNFVMPFRDISLRLPEPEAFALHKLIISQRRKKKEKKEKDIEAVRGMFQFFKGKASHVRRLHRIIGELPKSWRK